MTEWIAIETPPERGQYVLVFMRTGIVVGFLPKTPDPHGAIELMPYMKKRIPQFYFSGTRDKIVWPVTHWMPLPKEPQLNVRERP